MHTRDSTRSEHDREHGRHEEEVVTGQEDVLGGGESSQDEVGGETQRHDDCRLWPESLLRQGDDRFIGRHYPVQVETHLDHRAKWGQGAYDDAGATNQNNEPENGLQGPG